MNMTTRFHFFAIAIAALAGCTAIEGPAVAPDADGASGAATELVFTATREAVAPDTKTVKLDNGAVW